MNYVKFIFFTFLILVYSCSFEATKFTSVEYQSSVPEFEKRFPASLGDFDCLDGVDDFLNSFEESEKKARSAAFVKNQCEFGSCWVQAGTTLMEGILKSDFNREVELSSSFIFYNHIKEQILEHVTTFVSDGFKFSNVYDATNVIKDAGTLTRYQYLIRKYGVMPESGADYRAFEISDPEKYKEFKKELHEYLYSLKYSQDIQSFQQKYQNISDAPSSEYFNLSELLKIRALKILDKYYGLEKSVFNFQGKELNALEFSRDYDLATKRLDVIYRNEDDSNLSQMEKVLQTRVDNNELTYINVFWYDSLVDDETGKVVLQDKFISHRTLEKIKKHPGHAVVLLDYKTNNLGQVTEWVIQNSFGDEVGQSGVFTVDADYLRVFLRSVQFFKD